MTRNPASKLIAFEQSYAFDKGLNLIQRNSQSDPLPKSRMIACDTSNRAISQALYASLNLTPGEQAGLNTTLLKKGIFDRHGNQKITKTNQNLSWDYRGMLQGTTTKKDGYDTVEEYNLYAKTGQRNRKVSTRLDQSNHAIEIKESIYLGNLEYRTTWKGDNLTYDGQTVTEKDTGQMVTPNEQYNTLRITQGHKQVAQKCSYLYKDGTKVLDQTIRFSLDNNIDSCELSLNGLGQMASFESFKPYGEAAISYGQTQLQPYKFSGQEKDESGLYYYGFRSLDSATFRWVSPDPSGLQGSGLNWYAMTSGNPMTIRDAHGLAPGDDSKHHNALVISNFSDHKFIPNSLVNVIIQFIGIRYKKGDEITIEQLITSYEFVYMGGFDSDGSGQEGALRLAEVASKSMYVKYYFPVSKEIKGSATDYLKMIRDADDNDREVPGKDKKYWGAHLELENAWSSDKNCYHEIHMEQEYTSKLSDMISTLEKPKGRMPVFQIYNVENMAIMARSRREAREWKNKNKKYSGDGIMKMDKNAIINAATVIVNNINHISFSKYSDQMEKHAAKWTKRKLYQYIPADSEEPEPLPKKYQFNIVSDHPSNHNKVRMINENPPVFQMNALEEADK